MGILDEAIREHLELKRHHGAEESEIEGLEAEAFGPADRPDATSPEAGVDPGIGGEAETRVISPGSSLTAPAGEGDQLDKVFDASRQTGEEAGAAPGQEKAEAGAAPDQKKADHAPEASEPSAGEHRIPPVSQEQPPAAEAAPEAPAPDEAAPEGAASAKSVSQEAAPAKSGTPPPSAPAGDDGDADDDAGDALERERENLASHPTEHYDVDAAIAEENENDVLSESSLSEELDRALDGPEDDEPEAEAEFEPEFEAAPVEKSHDESDAPDSEITEPEADSGDEAEDVLEETPDFLEETPEHDRLWFEQKEPDDFDFGD